MFKNIKQDWRANSKSINHAGFRVLVIYRLGQWRMTIKSKLLRTPLSIVYRLLEKHVRFKYGIELPYTVQLGDNVTFEHQHGIVIHGNSVIGSNCIIRQGVTVGNRSLEKPLEAPMIGDNVSIGAGAKILGAIKVGNFAVIGANAVVVKDVPEFGVAVGIPANVVKINSPFDEKNLSKSDTPFNESI